MAGKISQQTAPEQTLAETRYLKQLTEDPWLRQIPEHYLPGQIVKGKVTKLTNFGVFVELEDDLEGLLHISELADDYVSSVADVCKVGDEMPVKVILIDEQDRVKLSRKQALREMKPAEAASDLRAKATFDIDRIEEIEKTTQHDVIAFTTAVAGSVTATVGGFEKRRSCTPR